MTVHTQTEEQVGADRWALFAGLWGWVLLLHQATFDRWQYSPLGWALTALAVGLVLAPRSLFLLMATVLVDAAYAVQCMPATANHLVFEGVVCLGWSALVAQRSIRVLSELRTPAVGRPVHEAGSWRRLWTLSPGEEHPFEISRAPLRVALLLVYWLSVLHKLNYDFVDPETSCAAYMYRRVSETLSFLPRAPWAVQLSIWGTLLAEAALPVLLSWRRTWQLGLVAALSFHLMLAFDPTPGIYSFSALLFALFILVLPRVFIETATAQLNGLLARVGARSPSRARLGALLVLVGIIAYGATQSDRWAFQPGFAFFLVWAALVITGYLVTLLALPDVRPAARADRRQTPAWLWAVPAIVLLSGLNPYLGLRTQLSFSMFSNLRTEGGSSNHLFMPRWLRLGGYQEDLVEILETDDPDLATLRSERLLLPYFELRRRVSELDDVTVTYLRGGRQETFICRTGTCNDAELAKPHSRLLGRLLYFRPVDKGPHMLCRH